MASQILVYEIVSGDENAPITNIMYNGILLM